MLVPIFTGVLILLFIGVTTVVGRYLPPDRQYRQTLDSLSKIHYRSKGGE